jgi:hypothetical protein
MSKTTLTLGVDQAVFSDLPSIRFSTGNGVGIKDSEYWVPHMAVWETLWQYPVILNAAKREATGNDTKTGGNTTHNREDTAT